ncbi:MAG: hypothetical protein CVV44_20175 [Spirochaetae bacterium HGW-Spirochaetae-1]|jgi:hypothetical protein|nr:MAG: hypothetical protein CVV44_20175 [Spirochaetae bacterium HGW-Spirochaetae-1]
MLPKRLKEVKMQIEKKSFHQRTKKELELLEELIALDNVLDYQVMRKAMLEDGGPVAITSGPGNCPCCGK